MVNFLPLVSPKIRTSKNLQHLQPKLLQWVHHIYRLALCYSKYVYHVILFYIHLWIKMFMLLIVNGKSWLYSSHKLDAHSTFIAFIKLEPLWLKLWSFELENSCSLGVSTYVLLHGKLSTLHLCIFSWCHVLLFMDAYHGEIKVETS